MNPIQIAGLVFQGLGTLAPLAASLLTADKERAAQILAAMRDELAKMQDAVLAMDREFADHDAALDKKIAEAEAPSVADASKAKVAE